MNKSLITTVPFGSQNRFPLEILEANNIEYIINPFNTKLKEEQLLELTTNGIDTIIAGTEPITRKVIENAKDLKHISRVGIGLDSVDLIAAKENGIKVSYTPDAPAPAVAELTIGLMLSLLRGIHISNSELHRGKWQRHYGKRIAEITIGMIGIGRIGTRVLRRLKSFGSPRLLVNDVMPNLELNREFKIEWASKELLYKEADLITLHVPLTQKTKDMITAKELSMMKPNALLINTSRGGIIKESDLYDCLSNNHLGGVAIDVFENEPYSGPLSKIDKCLLTAHMGSMSIDCRTRMEIEATEETIRFKKDLPLLSEVPESEYKVQTLFV
tara:strand:+ start:82 stop:1068 length:987 start_codon:yes stop_codon:yes gene_type:complete